jgi:hypothetical protein
MLNREIFEGEAPDVEPIYRAACDAGCFPEHQNKKLMLFRTPKGTEFYIVSTNARTTRIDIRLHPDTDEALLARLSEAGDVSPEFKYHSNMGRFPRNTKSPGSSDLPCSRQLILSSLESLKKAVRILDGEGAEFNASANDPFMEHADAERFEPAAPGLVSDGSIETDGTAEVTIRIGQDRLREELLSKENGTCELTGIRIPRLLRTSHIKPWAESDDAERLDIENVLLLSPNADALFDQGFISFDDEGRLLISAEISPEDLQRLGISPAARLRSPISAKKRGYLAYHRANIFRKTL